MANEKLIDTIKEALKEKRTREITCSCITSSIFETELLGESEVMKEIFYKIQKIAPTDAKFNTW